MTTRLKFALIEFAEGVRNMSEGDLRVCKRAKLLVEALNAEPVEDKPIKLEGRMIPCDPPTSADWSQ